MVIIRLKHVIELSNHIQPIKLPAPNNTEKIVATVTGWGGIFPHDPEISVYQQQRLSCQLMEVDLILIPSSDEACKQITWDESDSKICAFKEGADSCQGDSGK